MVDAGVTPKAFEASESTTQTSASVRSTNPRRMNEQFMEFLVGGFVVCIFWILSPDAVNAADCRSETRRRSHREKRLLPDSDLSSAEFGKIPLAWQEKKVQNCR